MYMRKYIDRLTL